MGTVKDPDDFLSSRGECLCNICVAHLFPDESGALLVEGRFIVVVDIKLRKQDLIFV